MLTSLPVTFTYSPIETLLCDRFGWIIVRTQSELEPAEMVGGDFNLYFNCLPTAIDPTDDSCKLDLYVHLPLLAL